MITNFLKTKRTKDDLKIALEVLREFKSNESTGEWQLIMFAAWVKLEQLEEFLSYLVEGEPLKEDTIAYMNRHEA
jgi:predicted transcriptional regulator